MKWFSAWVFIIAVTGCETMRPSEASPFTPQRFAVMTFPME